jgi:hypothetical protein
LGKPDPAVDSLDLEMKSSARGIGDDGVDGIDAVGAVGRQAGTATVGDST